MSFWYNVAPMYAFAPMNIPTNLRESWTHEGFRERIYANQPTIPTMIDPQNENMVLLQIPSQVMLLQQFKSPLDPSSAIEPQNIVHPALVHQIEYYPSPVIEIEDHPAPVFELDHTTPVIKLEDHPAPVLELEEHTTPVINLEDHPAPLIKLEYPVLPELSGTTVAADGAIDSQKLVQPETVIKLEYPSMPDLSETTVDQTPPIQLQIAVQQASVTKSEMSVSKMSTLKLMIKSRTQSDLTCPHCDRPFMKQCSLTQHINYHHKGVRPFKCSKCGKRFNTKEQNEKHALLHHKDNEKKKFCCVVCPRTYVNRADLVRHEQLHYRTRMHDYICKKKFVRMDQMLRHQMTRSCVIFKNRR